MLGAALVALCVMAAIAVTTTRWVQSLGHELAAESARLASLQSSLVVDVERAVSEIHSAPSELDLVQLKAKQDTFQALMRDAKKIALDAFASSSVPTIRDNGLLVSRLAEQFEVSSNRVFAFAADFAQSDAIAEISKSVVPAETALQDALKQLRRSAELNDADKEAAIDRTMTTITWIVIGPAAFLVLVIGVSGYVTVTRGVVGPITFLKDVMVRLSEGDIADVPYSTRSDEIGHMAKAVQVFKDNMLRAAQLEREQMEARERRTAEDERVRKGAELAAAAEAADIVVSSIGMGLERLAAGDLTFRLHTALPAAYV